MDASVEPMWTDVAQAWGSIIGAVGSILAVMAAGGLLLHEIRSRNAERRDAEAAQARTVQVEVDGDGEAGRGMHSIGWKITNHSTEPIRGAILTLERLDGQGAANFKTEHIGAIPPGQEKHGRWRLDPFVAWPALEPDRPVHHIQWSVEVLDARGLIWDLADGHLPKRHIVAQGEPRI